MAHPLTRARVCSVGLVLGGAVAFAISTGASTSSAQATALSRCVAGHISASASYQGATQSMAGSIQFTNTGAQPCSMGGYLNVQLTEQGGTALAVKVRHSNAHLIGGAVNRVLRSCFRWASPLLPSWFSSGGTGVGRTPVHWTCVWPSRMAVILTLFQRWTAITGRGA